MFPNVLTVLSLVSAIVILLIIKFLFYLKTFPPGPFPLPIIGSMYALRNDCSYDKQFARWSKKYGEIMTMWIGTTPVYVISSWKLIHEGNIVKRDHFIDRPKILSFKNLNGKRRGVAGDDGEAWVVLRRAAVVILRKYYNSSRMPENVRWGLQKGLEETLVLNRPFNIMELATSITQNVSFATLFGQRHDDDDEDFKKMRIIPFLLREGFCQSLWSDYIGLYRFFFSGKTIQRHKEGVLSFIELIKNNLERHEKTFQKDDIRDLTDSLIASKEQCEEEMKSSSAYFTEDNMAQVLLELYQGGADTTSVLLSWLFKIIAHYPEIQNKMREEIDTVTGDRDITPEDRNKCPFTEAVIMETLRLFNVGAGGILRRTTVDTELGGYKIPKGSTVHFVLCAPSMDPTLWPEPEQFKPERFLDSVTSDILKVKFPGFCSFGVGKRNCVGERLAFMHAFLIIAALIRRFQFSEPKGGVLDTRTEPGIIVAVPKPFHIIMMARQDHL